MPPASSPEARGSERVFDRLVGYEHLDPSTGRAFFDSYIWRFTKQLGPSSRVVSTLRDNHYVRRFAFRHAGDYSTRVLSVRERCQGVIPAPFFRALADLERLLFSHARAR
jgi:hypothetical protein